jgi:hypothetical protein
MCESRKVRPRDELSLATMKIDNFFAELTWQRLSSAG